MAKSFNLERWWYSHTRAQIIFSTLTLLLALLTIIFALSSFTHWAGFSVLKNLISATALADPSLAMAITFFASVLCLGFVVAAKLWPQEAINWEKIKRDSSGVVSTKNDVAPPPPLRRAPPPPMGVTDRPQSSTLTLPRGPSLTRTPSR